MRAIMAQAMRAILLARAMAAILLDRLSRSLTSQGWRVYQNIAYLAKHSFVSTFH